MAYCYGALRGRGRGKSPLPIFSFVVIVSICVVLFLFSFNFYYYMVLHLLCSSCYFAVFIYLFNPALITLLLSQGSIENSFHKNRNKVYIHLILSFPNPTCGITSSMLRCLEAKRKVYLHEPNYQRKGAS